LLIGGYTDADGDAARQVAYEAFAQDINEPKYKGRCLQGLIQYWNTVPAEADTIPKPTAQRGKKVLPCHGLLELTHTARN
jgi:hypothetical protein